MNLEEIEDRISLLEDKSKNRIQHYFQEYLMIDVIGQVSLETTFDNDDWQHYKEDLTTDVKEIIDELLIQTGLIHKKGVGYDYDRSSAINVLLKRAVICKYNIDYTLSSPIYIQKSETPVTYSLPPLSISNSFKNKSKIIEAIFEFLSEKDRIVNCKKEDFSALFQPIENPCLIQWNKDAIDFVSFINTLLDRVIIIPAPFNGKHLLYLSMIFLNQNGCLFNKRTLGNRATEVSYDEKKAFYIENLMPLIQQVSNND